jgi:hypothetical protein
MKCYNQIQQQLLLFSAAAGKQYIWFASLVTTTYHLKVFIKVTVSRDFRLLVFFHESISPKPLSIPLVPFQICSKIRGNIRSSRCTTGIVEKWEKSSILKVFIILFGHLWEVKLTYRYIFAFKFTLRSQQPDIAPIILPPVSTTPAKLVAKFSPVLLTPEANLPMVSLILVVHLDLRISLRIFENI